MNFVIYVNIDRKTSLCMKTYKLLLLLMYY